ncbi:MAG: DegT/DnrJ/EryC1/StrS family aminotransferase [Candidatus Omnitrophica bacterium]|nr:DegT/DnrJ/EryC1/StrS family aminotransferase [Candidatus Omnitrophota bacterium]
MRISFIDLNAQYKELKKDIDLAIKEVIKRGDFILGKDLRLFEEEFARFCNAKYAVGLNSGTDALFLALKSLGIGPDDEVIVPAFTFIATSLAVSYTGARPVFVDIREDTYNINPEGIKKVITKNTKAIIPVHLFGQPADMPKILELAKEYNLKVIEDSAQAHGARIRMEGCWRKVGAIGDIGCFSLYPTKNLSAMGDGGIIVTNAERIYKKILMLRDYGRVSRYKHIIIGYNSRLDTIQAGILRVKLKRLDKWNLMRRRIARLYDRLLKDIPQIITPYVSPDVKHVYHLYVIRTKLRDKLLKVFNKKGIPALIHYPIPLHLQKVYKNLGYKKGDFPVAEKVASQILSLPMYPHLKEEQVRFIVGILKQVRN